VRAGGVRVDGALRPRGRSFASARIGFTVHG
jgi:hypothetical protein